MLQHPFFTKFFPDVSKCLILPDPNNTYKTLRKALCPPQDLPHHIREPDKCYQHSYPVIHSYITLTILYELVNQGLIP